MSGWCQAVGTAVRLSDIGLSLNFSLHVRNGLKIREPMRKLQLVGEFIGGSPRNFCFLIEAGIGL